MIFKVKIAIVKFVEIEAKTEDQAERKVREMFDDGDIDFSDEVDIETTTY